LANASFAQKLPTKILAPLEISLHESQRQRALTASFVLSGWGKAAYELKNILFVLIKRAFKIPF